MTGSPASEFSKGRDRAAIPLASFQSAPSRLGRGRPLVEWAFAFGARREDRHVAGVQADTVWAVGGARTFPKTEGVGGG